MPVSRNVVAVNLRANELRDSPLQRNGPLYGKTVNVDITVTGTNADGSTWYGTPFADASGYIALIGRTVAERTAIGGAINLISAGDVVAVNGSTMNVSGGWLDYQSGIVSTTRLLGTDGHLYDIANADPNLTYVGIAGGITITHPRWGVTETFSTPLVSATDQRFEQGYLDGRSAGSIADYGQRNDPGWHPARQFGFRPAPANDQRQYGFERAAWRQLDPAGSARYEYPSPEATRMPSRIISRLSRATLS